MRATGKRSVANLNIALVAETAPISQLTMVQMKKKSEILTSVITQLVNNLFFPPLMTLPRLNREIKRLIVD